jgi:hypothetical protein
MADLTGHAAGNGGHSQGTPTAHRALLYSDIDGNVVNQELSGKDSYGTLPSGLRLAFFRSFVQPVQLFAQVAESDFFRTEFNAM